MAQFGGMELTNGGRTLIAKAIGGQVLKFTKGVAGDGYLPRDHDVSEMTQIIHPIREMEIAAIDIPPRIGTAKVSVIMTNKDLTEGFFFREIGIYARDPDTEQEVLYGYCNAGDKADYLPGQDGPDAVYYRFDLTVVVDKAKNVTAIFSDNPLAVTHSQLEKRLDAVMKSVREREEQLQHQIDCLVDAGIHNLLDHVGQKHWQG